MRRNKKLLLSLVVSAILHLFSIHFIAHYSFWISTTPHVESSVLSKVAKNEILRETFTRKKEQEFHLVASTPSEQRESLIISSKLQPLHIEWLPKPISFPIEKHLISPSNDLIDQTKTISFSIPLYKPFDLFHHIPQGLIIPQQTRSTQTPIIDPQAIQTSLQARHLAPPAVEVMSHRLQSEKKTPSSVVSLKETTASITTTLPSSFVSLSSLPSLETLETICYSQYFDADIVFLPREDGEGYLFAVTLIPRQHVQLPKLTQHYSFLIDKSNSIQKERLLVAKNAVYKALNELDCDDTFNIIAFDSKIEKLSQTPLQYSPEALKLAKDFLDKIELGSFFSTSNFIKPLFLTLPFAVKESELHTAIVLTDGELLAKKGAEKALLYDWTDQNANRVSLFALGMGGDPHLACLETATAFNKGSMIYSPSKGSIKRKLIKLMRSVSHPIAKNITYKAIGLHKPSSATLYPKQAQIPHLYLNEPYVIVGTTNQLEPFVLFIQGKFKDQWVHIKKRISFDHAKKGGNSLKEKWVMQQVYSLYERYLCDHNFAHITHAQHLLEPYGIKAVFQ